LKEEQELVLAVGGGAGLDFVGGGVPGGYGEGEDGRKESEDEDSHGCLLRLLRAELGRLEWWL
jgi:hypothetical protein